MTTIRRYYSFSTLFRREGMLWVAQCLEIDVVSQGATLRQAQTMLVEAVELVLSDDLLQGKDPQARGPAPEEDRALYRHALEFGERRTSNDVEQLPGVNFIVATPLFVDFQVELADHIAVLPPELDLTKTPTRLDFGATFVDALAA